MEGTSSAAVTPELALAHADPAASALHVGTLGLVLEPGSTSLWEGGLFSVSMMSGGIWTMTLGDALIVLTLVFLFVEIVKSTRTSNVSIIDHLLSTFVFVAYLVEFLLVQGAAHQVFFILMVITLIDA